MTRGQAARILVIALTGMMTAAAMAQTTQYWDSSTSAGYQHGSGIWSTNSTDANWNGVGGTAPLMGWTNGNNASYSAAAGASTVTVSGVVTAGLMTVDGRVYTLNIPGGAALYTTTNVVIGSADNAVQVSGNPALWNGGGANLTIGTSGTPSDNGNVLRIDGNGAVVTNIGSFWLGWGAQGSKGNTLIVTNGGRLYSGTTVIGLTYSPNNKAVVSGGGALWSLNNKNLSVGGSDTRNTNNVIFIDAQGIPGNAVVTNVATLNIGEGTGAANAGRLIVTNGGRLHCTSIWNIGNGNGAIVSGGGSLLNLGNGTWTVGWGNSGMLSTIDGQGTLGGAVVTNMSGILLGYKGGNLNTFVVTNGGSLFCGTVGVGYDSAFSNKYIISGGPTACVVSNGLITIGMNAYAGSNSMTVANANLSSAGLNVGIYNTNINNTVYAGSGTVWNLLGKDVQVGAAAATNRGNTLMIDKGAVLTNILTLTVYSNNAVSLNGGTLGVKNLTYTNGLGLFSVGDGAQAATLQALGGSLVFTNGLVINPNATLTGYGKIAATTDVYGVLSPGLSFGIVTNGIMTNAGPVILRSGAQTVISIATNTTAGFGWGLEVVQGPLTVNGQIKVVLTGPYRPASSATFLVMTNTTADMLVGSFSESTASVYTNANFSAGKALGTFRIITDTHSVTLSGFKVTGSGTLLLVK